MINVVDVTHHYRVRPVLKRVNLFVRAGDVVALMGPNGMGKSTLMGLMAGTLWPITGHVEIDGKRRRESEAIEMEIRRQVVYLPADPFLPKSRTGREWVLAVGRVYGVDEHRLLDHTQRLLDLFDLTKNADSSIASYSTGQQKKIALCGALVTEAPIMLLDEPFAGGMDPSGIAALKRVLQHLAKRDDFTIVIATPVSELVEEIADRVAIVIDGEIRAYETIDALKRAQNASTLEQAYERLVNPQIEQKVQQYFQEAGK
jgi:ABC-type multidrug transport system ATPase subunit